MESGEVKSGVAMLKQAVEKEPAIGEIRYHLAVALSRSGETGGGAPDSHGVTGDGYVVRKPGRGGRATSVAVTLIELMERHFLPARSGPHATGPMTTVRPEAS